MNIEFKKEIVERKDLVKYTAYSYRNQRDLIIYLEIDRPTKKIKILNSNKEPKFVFAGDYVDDFQIINELIKHALIDAKESLR